VGISYNMRSPHAVSIQSIMPERSAASPALRPDEEPKMVIEFIFPIASVSTSSTSLCRL